ncbi:MAG: glycosyltransferase family 2 protein [Magnetococcales bacterium]|nr:glycosyltransferase family 2 protein [Magnetococcales bacterium]
MLTDKLVSVVVACYKDEGSVSELLERLERVLGSITPNWEVIYVNDASPDNAEAVLLQKVKTHPRLTVISHSRNFGAQVAFFTGMAQARGDAVVIMDGDIQDPPEMIRDFAIKWLEGNEVVYGIRAKRAENVVRRIGYYLFYRLFRKLAYIDIPLDAGEFSLMDRRVVNVILACPERDLLIRGLRAFAGFRQVGIPFFRPQRFAGESTQSMLSYFMWAYKAITSYSLAPLRMITTMSIFFTLFLIILSLVFILLYLSGKDAPHGFMTLAMLILGCSSVIMISLGIIAEYLGRLFVEVKKRPQPVLRTIVNDQRQDPLNWPGMVSEKADS